MITNDKWARTKSWIENLLLFLHHMLSHDGSMIFININITNIAAVKNNKHISQYLNISISSSQELSARLPDCGGPAGHHLAAGRVWRGPGSAWRVTRVTCPRLAPGPSLHPDLRGAVLPQVPPPHRPPPPGARPRGPGHRRRGGWSQVTRRYSISISSRVTSHEFWVLSHFATISFYLTFISLFIINPNWNWWGSTQCFAANTSSAHSFHPVTAKYLNIKYLDI